MAYTVTNATVDAAAAAVAGTYGPLTRVSDVETFPTPNSQQLIAFTSNVATTPVSMTYEQLLNTDTRDAILEIAHSWTGIVTAMKTAITDLNTLAVAMTAPHTYADYQALVDYIRENFPWIRGIVG